MDVFFKIALFLIPFDNLPFAPSQGWGAISPIIFFAYVVINLKYLPATVYKEMKLILATLGVLTYGFLLYFIYTPDLGNTINSLMTLVLGLSFYFSLIMRYVIQKKNINNDIKYLINGYSVSLFYGLIKYLSLKFNIDQMLTIFKLIEKRYYDRLGFTFTEPSFISMHMFGVLLFVFFIVTEKKMREKITVLILCFSLLTIISGSSGRFFVDLVFVALVVIIFNIFSHKIKNSYKIVFLLSIPILYITLANVILENPRINRITSDGIYTDASLAARYFRINASIKGYEKEPIKVLFGNGIGNSYYFFQSGYKEAFSEFKNGYIDEVRSLKSQKPSQLYCMPIRIISEFGFLLFLLIIILLLKETIKYNGNFIMLLLIFWLYMQFDSYAFYSIWIYLFVLKYKVRIESISS